MCTTQSEFELCVAKIKSHEHYKPYRKVEVYLPSSVRDGIPSLEGVTHFQIFGAAEDMGALLASACGLLDEPQTGDRVTLRLDSQKVQAILTPLSWCRMDDKIPILGPHRALLRLAMTIQNAAMAQEFFVVFSW